MKKQFIFALLFMSMNIDASPWIKKEGNIQVINTTSIYITPDDFQGDNLLKKIKSLKRSFSNIATNNKLSDTAKEERRKTIQGNIDKLQRLYDEKTFYDIFSNDSYIEYSYSDGLAIGGNIFVNNKYKKSNGYFISIFAKYKLFEEGGFIGSVIAGFSYGDELGGALGISGGYSWSSKYLDYFTYVEPTINFNSKHQEVTIDYVNGMKFKNDWMLISQTIYKRDKDKSKLSEKISIVKRLEVEGYDILYRNRWVYFGKR